MKGMKKVSPIQQKFLLFFIVFVLMAGLFGWLYKIGVNRPPLKYAHIPISTMDYIRGLGNLAKDQGISIKDKGPFKWDNDDDLGKQEDQKWAHEEDENFIVYYHHDNEAQWQAYAQDVLREANNNIDQLIDLMGKYMFAADMNNRKLAIYLPETKDLYASTIATLMDGHASRGSESSLGITITEIGPLGCLTKGIVLNPMNFEVDPNDINGYIKTLKHEMCHYVFFSSLNYGKEIKHYLWVSEGIAEYFCDRHDHRQIHQPDSIDYIDRNCALNGDFPNEMQNASYWAGESFYRYLDKKLGRAGVKKFVQDAYNYSTDSVFIKERKPAKKTHDDWVKMLRSIKYTPAAPAPQEMTDSMALAQQAQTQAKKV